MRPSPGRRRAAGALAATLALTSCSFMGSDAGPSPGRAALPGPDPTTTVPSDPPPETGPAPTTATPTPIEWRACGDHQCAQLAAPLDYSNPDGETIELAVRRIPARGERLGALFFNPGGPGASAIDLLGPIARIMPAAVRDRFDIVAVDPRGVGRSTPLACGLDGAELYGVDPTIDSPEDVTALLDVSARYVEDCRARALHLLPHVGTRAVARDMDLVRAAMGDETINYLGFSYGSAIGQVYAEMFGPRVRSMVLDGLVDLGNDGIAGARIQAAGFETALARWAADCSADPTCPVANDPIGAVESVLAAAEVGIPAGAATVGPGEAELGLAGPLYDQRQWDDLARAVADAEAGDGRALLRLAESFLDFGALDAYFAVSCLDADWPRDTDEFLAEAKAAAEVAPHFGEAVVIDYIRCALWPVPAQPLGPVTAARAGPILVISTTGDPATPYEDGVATAERLAQGVLITYDGDGHTITFQGSACVDTLVVGYLVDLEVPAEPATCP